MVKDTTIDIVATGQSINVYKGDVVFFHPYMNNMDPEIFDNPTAFVPDRYLGKDGRVDKGKFTKNGKRVPCVDSGFGFGDSLCPGRFFAMNEMKIFILMMFMNYDIHLLPNQTLPQIAWDRMDFVIPPPDSNVYVSLSKK